MWRGRPPPVLESARPPGWWARVASTRVSASAWARGGHVSSMGKPARIPVPSAVSLWCHGRGPRTLGGQGAGKGARPAPAGPSRWSSVGLRPFSPPHAFPSLPENTAVPAHPAPRPARSCGTAAVTGSGARLPALPTWCVRSGATSGLCRAWLLDRTQAACMANLRSRLGCPPHPFSTRDRWLPTTKLHPLWSMHPSLHREQPKGLWAAPAGQRALVCVGQHMSIRALVTQGTPGSTSW